MYQILWLRFSYVLCFILSPFRFAFLFRARISSAVFVCVCVYVDHQMRHVSRCQPARNPTLRTRTPHAAPEADQQQRVLLAVDSDVAASDSNSTNPAHTHHSTYLSLTSHATPRSTLTPHSPRTLLTLSPSVELALSPTLLLLLSYSHSLAAAGCS